MLGLPKPTPEQPPCSGEGRAEQVPVPGCPGVPGAVPRVVAVAPLGTGRRAPAGAGWKQPPRPQPRPDLPSGTALLRGTGPPRRGLSPGGTGRRGAVLAPCPHGCRRAERPMRHGDTGQAEAPKRRHGRQGAPSSREPGPAGSGATAGACPAASLVPLPLSLPLPRVLPLILCPPLRAPHRAHCGAPCPAMESQPGLG